MATFDVTLPAGKTIVFPPRCVVCEAKNPDGMIELSFLGVQSGSVIEMAVDKVMFDNIDPKYYGSNTLNKIDGIPACKGCASSLKWYHRLLKLAYYTAWIPGFILFLLLPGPAILRALIIVIFAILPGIFTLMFPPSFGASFFNSKANFEFKSKTVAEEFLKLNGEAVLKGSETRNSANASQAG